MKKYGVIGCGGVGEQKHIPAARRNPRTELFGVCDIDQEKVNKVAPSGVETFTDISKICSEVDAVSVAVPPNTHYEVLREVVEHDVDILCEKPFTPTLDEAKEILSLTENRVSEVNNTLFKPTMVRACSRVNEIGEPQTVFAQKSKRNTKEFIQNWGEWLEEIRGGAFGENLPHWIYRTRAFLGDIDKVNHVEIIDDKNTSITPSEITASIEAGNNQGKIGVSFRGDGPDCLIVIGSEGLMTIDFENRLVTTKGYPNSSSDILKGNVASGIDSIRQTIERAMEFGVDMVTRRIGLTPDFAYRNQGHYQQIDELVTGEMRVGRSDILNNVMVYDKITGEIDEAR